MEQHKMDELTTVEALLAENSREAVERIGELKGVDYCIDKKCDADIRVMTANLLYAKWDPQDPKLDKYPIRMRRTAECVNLYNPDFIGLQEAHPMMREPFDPYLKKKYEYVTFDLPKRNAEWFPILYRSDRWSLIDSGTGEYTECKHPWGYVWSTFVRKETSKEKITVMNLHYTVAHFMKVDPSWGEFHIQLAEEINRFIRKQLCDNKDVPIVITGDYNTGRDTELYEAMINGLLMEDAPLLTEDSNMTYEQKRHPWLLDHITVTRDTVDVVRHRKLDCYPTMYMSDHPYYFADIRKNILRRSNI